MNSNSAVRTSAWSPSQPSLQTHVFVMLSHLRSLSHSVSDSTSPRTFYVSAAPFPVASISWLAEVGLHSFCINCLNTQTLTRIASTLEHSRNSKTLSQYHWHAYNLVRPHCLKGLKHSSSSFRGTERGWTFLLPRKRVLPEVY